MTSLNSGFKLTSMKKLSTYLFLILFSFSAPSFAEDISEYEIEGISIGDSLLNHLSKEEIITEIEKHKPVYNYLTDEFGEVYLYGKFEIYDHLSFIVKPNDKNYIIYHIRGSILYDDKIKQCYAKQKEIVEEFSVLYKNVRKDEKTYKFPFDPTGKSKTHNISFSFDSKDKIRVSCTEYEENLKIKNNWADSLQVVIQAKEITAWFSNRID